MRDSRTPPVDISLVNKKERRWYARLAEMIGTSIETAHRYHCCMHAAASRGFRNIEDYFPFERPENKHVLHEIMENVLTGTYMPDF